MPGFQKWAVLLCILPLAAAGGDVKKTVTVTVTAMQTVTTTLACSTTSAAPSSSSINTEEYPTTTEISQETGTKGLNDYAKETGKAYFGTAADIPGPEQQDDAYMTQLNNTHDFGQLTPANYMKYFATEPEQGVFNYTGGDVILDIAKANGQVVRCHNLVWHNQLPDWLTNGNWTNATLTAVLENHVGNLVSHWGTQCYAWDVVNEALNDDGTYRSDLWYDTIGPAYIPIAFAAAAKAAPDGVKLYYNDYNIENPGNKSTAAQNLVKELKAQNIRIDGVGLQSHFIVGETPSQASQEQNMAAFAALDVDVAITELDVRATQLPASAEEQTQQRADYYSSVAACTNTERCVGVTLWDFDDEYSWIPGVFAGQGYADVWFKANDSDTLIRKQAYDGIVEALTGQPES